MSATTRSDAVDAAVEPFTAALLDRDRALAERMVANLEGGGAAPATIYSRLFAPALRRVGDLWESGSISIAEEHIASALVEQLMAGLYPKLFTAPRASRERVLLACVEGERHVIGLRMVADLVEGAGFDAVFLGADTPLPALRETVERERPAAVLLAAKLDGSAPALAAAAHALRRCAPAALLLAGGDGALAIRDELPGALRVAFAEDIGAALRALERLPATAGSDPDQYTRGR